MSSEANIQRDLDPEREGYVYSQDIILENRENVSVSTNQTVETMASSEKMEGTINMPKNNHEVQIPRADIMNTNIGKTREPIAILKRKWIWITLLFIVILLLMNIATIIIMLTQLKTSNETLSDQPLTDCQGVEPLAGGRRIVRLAGGDLALCDTSTDLDSWLVFQHRATGDVDFYRDWYDYRRGFGNIRGDFWWGLEKLHRLTASGLWELRVDLVVDGRKFFQVYREFKVFGESQDYTISLRGDVTGNAGNSLNYHGSASFSTKDKDHDTWYEGNCAEEKQGGWWYVECQESNLNGRWNSTSRGQGVNWKTLTGYSKSATFTEMKVRRFKSRFNM